MNGGEDEHCNKIENTSLVNNCQFQNGLYSNGRRGVRVLRKEGEDESGLGDGGN